MKKTFSEIKNEIKDSGKVVIGNIVPLSNAFAINSFIIGDPILSVVKNDVFSISGQTEINNSRFIVELLFFNNETHFKVSLISDNQKQLQDLFPAASARMADYFYSAPIDMFNDVIVTESKIYGSSNDKEASVDMTLVFGEKSRLIERFYYLMPDSGTAVKFSGTIKENKHYSISAEYVKKTQLPILPEDNPNQDINKSKLTIISHIADFYNFAKEPSYMCNVLWEGQIAIEIGNMNNISLTYNLFDHGQRFVVITQFGKEGVSVSDMFKLMEKLSGRKDYFTLPDWFILRDLALRSIDFSLQKEVGKNTTWPGYESSKFVGVGIDVALKLPEIPIPFFEFEDDGKGAVISLYTRWDMMDLGGYLSMTARFESKWKGYGLILKLVIPDLYFEGKLYLEDPSKKPLSIFPGFLNLIVEDIHVGGSLVDNAYSLGFKLINDGNSIIKIADYDFKILHIEGSAFYSPEGLGMGLEMAFDLLGVLFAISGIYKRDGADSELNLSGRLLAPLSLSKLINLIFETNYDESFTIKQLSLSYTMSFKSNVDSGTPENFRFLCEIVFKWPQIELEANALADIQWTTADWNMSVEGKLTWMKFFIGASCKLKKSDGGELSFEEVKFAVGFRDMLVTAEIKGDELIFKFDKINLAVLIEELVNTIIPGTNWYIPWPFKILKQLTINGLEIRLNDKKQTMSVIYPVNINILFFTIKSIELKYDGLAQSGETFTLELNIDGIITNNTKRILDKNDFRDDNLYPQVMDLLKGIYPILPGLSSYMFEMKYLAIGQHIEVPVPSKFNIDSVGQIMADLRKAIKTDGSPTVNENNNWIFGLQVSILKALNIDLLLCDPGFYGLKIEIVPNSGTLKQFAGLIFCILYGKVSETVGVFQIYLTLPEVFKKIELEYVDIYLGDIFLAIYTDGHFKIDCGFPHGGDFSKAFAVNVIAFFGRGGFYLAALTGDTSDLVPKVERGHFEFVLELGIGIAVGIGKEIHKSVLNAGAYIQVEAIFEGVFATYIPENASGTEEENALSASNSSAYFRLAAVLGIAAVVYGEIDAYVIKISISAKASLKVTAVFERYKKCHFDITLKLEISAKIKILFIKINFSFTIDLSFAFDIGKDQLPPWKNPSIAASAALAIAKGDAPVVINWNDGKVFDSPKDIRAVIAPEFLINNVSLNGLEGQIEYRTAFTVSAIGYQGETVKYLQNTFGPSDSSIALFVHAFLKRLLVSAFEKTEITFAELESLVEAVQGENVFNDGFSMSRVNVFLENNFRIKIIKGTLENINGEIHAVPMPLPPVVKVSFTAPGMSPQAYDLSKEPQVTDSFFKDIENYYKDLDTRDIRVRNNIKEVSESAPASVFRDYFYLLTKAALSEAVDNFPDDKTSLSVDEIIALTADEKVLDNICGMMSRFLLSGIRVPENNYLTSLYSFACQQYASALPKDGETHTYEMELIAGQNWLELQNEVLLSDLNTRNIVLDAGEPAQKLVWEIPADKVKYPSEKIDYSEKVQTAPYYEEQFKTISLNKPVKAQGEELVFYKAAEPLPKDCSVIVETDPEKINHSSGIDFKRGHLLYMQVTHVKDDVYSLMPLGYENIQKLYKMTGDVTGIKAYRNTNPLDFNENAASFESGIVSLPDEEKLFLYRSNLSLETEKPITKNDNHIASADTQPDNSAYMQTQTKGFLKLLRDASLVNSKGYYIRCDIPEQILDEGKAEIVLWVEYAENAETVCVKSSDAKEGVPAVITKELLRLYKFKPGETGFVFDIPVPGEEEYTKNLFQMMSYRIKESELFRISHDSMPLPAQFDHDRWIFSQTVPAARFVKGYDGNPYKGISKDSCLELKFFLLDLFGNKTTDAMTLRTKYGYSDPLISPSSYPQTNVCYTVKQNENGISFNITFSFIENEENNNVEDLKNSAKYAYMQLAQEDVKLEAEIMGNKRETLDKAPLVNYLERIYKEGHVSEPVTYEINTKKPSDFINEIYVILHINRDESFVANGLSDTKKYENITHVSSSVPMNEDENAGNDYANITKNGETGNFYFIQAAAVNLSDIQYWSLRPLSTKLVNLADIILKDIDKNDVKTSFNNIDLEEWADIFMKDFEDFIAPGSALIKDRQDVLEQLMKIKEKLALSASSGVLSVLKTDNTSYAKKAQECFNDAMLRNLYTGRRTNAVVIMKTGVPEHNGYNLFGSVLACVNDSGIEISARKIKEDGLLAFTVNCGSVESMKEINTEIKYTVTDWEQENPDRPQYFTLMAPRENASKALKIPLPYKSYPQDVSLTEHSFEVPDKGPADWFNWNYKMEFSHYCLAQDSIFLKVILNDGKNAKASGINEFAAAMAQYIFLRDQIISGAAPVEILIEIAGNIASLWSYDNVLLSTAGSTESIEGYFSIEDKALIFASNIEAMKLPPAGVSLMDNEELWHDLAYAGNGKYIIPDNIKFKYPYRFAFTFGGLDIRKHRIALAETAVYRNQNIENINPQYIYRTPWFRYYNDVQPNISYGEIINGGAFSNDNFIKKIKEYAGSFSYYSIECSCGRLVSEKGGIYSFVPVLFAPDVNDSVLDDIFTKANKWLEKNMNNDNGGKIIVECYLSMSERSQKNKSVAEITKIRFNYA